jgi:hypothetical protein
LAALLLFAALAVLAGCGGAEQAHEAAPTPPHQADQTPARYRPGAPGCRAGAAPGTVDQIGEDVIGSRASDFVACFGQPVQERRAPHGRCLDYRQRGDSTYWRFCVREGRIVSALGNVPRPGDAGDAGR